MPARLENGIMAPEAGRTRKQTAIGHDGVVVSGISGRFPESENIAEFRENLINGTDMVTENNRRWEPGIHGLPRRNGTLKDISKFDASFFGVHPKQANTMDPQIRLLLEVTYEALVDAGVNPQAVRGSRTGVFVGITGSDSHEAWSSDLEKIVGYEYTGCTNSMFANRLSFFFDFKGPSCAFDTACSSSLLALNQALQAIRAGLCDAAIVGGSNLCLKPSTALQFQKLGLLSPDGACKSFDESGNGYCRSEAVVAIYIQKCSAAKRVYATLVHSRTNSDGNKEQGFTFPSGEAQTNLLDQVYSEAEVDPACVVYVEAHGTGTKAGDPQEVNSLVEILCKTGRKEPLLIGSTKSNMGHPEQASGLAALAKLLIAMEDRAIPANLHYRKPNPDIPALVDGRVKVVAERTPFSGGYAAINSFGLGGSNVHTLLKSHEQEVIAAHPAADFTRLFTCGGRTQESVQQCLDEMRKNASNVEMQSLLQNNADASPATHGYRGFALLNSDKVGDIEKCSTESRPLWFVFSGLGTQWPGMGKDLLTLDLFRESILRSGTVLQPYGVDLYDLMMNGDEVTFSDTLNAFVCIAAIQVALVDILSLMGIEPDGIVGHSSGELACAYADGGLTAEEIVLAAYWAGRSVREAKLPPGAMAAVGLTWQEAKDRCPQGIVPACHNAQDTVTISGPAEAVAAFVDELQRGGVFARDVKSDVPFHSDYMAKAVPGYHAALKKVIKEPRPRSNRWISSSIPESEWGSDMAKYSSADYHANNMISSVLFYEALQHVPPNAVTIEVAPHCLLQAVLKRSLGPSCTLTGLMNRRHRDNTEFFFSNLGKLYMAGVNFDPLKLYEPVKYPVPRGTPMLSSLVKWDHSQSWDVPRLEQFSAGGAGSSACCVYEVDVSPESDDHYLVDHMIDGRVLFPATGYLVLAWRTLAKMTGQIYEQTPVTFENVQIHRGTILPRTGTLKLEVNITPGSGKFEVCENGTLVVSGRIYVPSDPVLQIPVYESQSPPEDADLMRLTTSDIYKELRLRGYDYGPSFQGILSSSNSGKDGHLEWKRNWVTFLDTMLQSQVLGLPERDLLLSTRIKTLRIDPKSHIERVHQDDSGTYVMRVVVDRELDTCVAGGVEILSIHTTVAPRRQHQQNPPLLEECHFVPHVEDNLSENDADLRCYTDVCKAYINQQVSKLLEKGLTAKLQNVDLFKKNVVSMCSGEQGMLVPELKAKGDMLNVLEKVFHWATDSDEFMEFTANIIKSSQKDLLDDRLLGSLCSERSLKTCLDVVLENSKGTKVKVVEYGAAEGEMYRHILPQLSVQPLWDVDYIISGPRLDLLDQSDVDQHDLQSVDWNMEQGAPSQLAGADLVVLSNVLHKEKNISAALSRLCAVVRENGFLLVQEPTTNFAIPLTLEGLTTDICCGLTDLDQRSSGPFCDTPTWSKLFTQSGLEVICQKSQGLLNTLFLCRKCPRVQEMTVQTVIDISDLDFSWVDDVKEAMISHQEAPPGKNIWLTAEAHLPSGAVGLVNCLRKEPGGDRIRCLISSSLQPDSAHKLPENNTQEFHSLVHKDLVMNVLRDGHLGSFRHISCSQGNSVDTEHAFVNVLTRGDLSSLRWIESPLKYFNHKDHPEKQLCSVYYASLNFRDIMLATGKLPPDAIPGNLASQDCILGMEFSGRDTYGKRVMGLLPAKGLATTVAADRRFLWEVPDSWSLEQAATVPVVYTTVYYSLVVRGRIKKGDKVLIHSGSGGVGQAAISVALNHGCEVFTTVGSRRKKAYLKKRFPELSDKCFANSRDKTFTWDILRGTRGTGVDLILNSLTEEKLQASLRVLAQHGRFLEIGKFDLSNNTPLGMAIFLKNISFHGILLDALFEEGNSEWAEVSSLLSEGIKQGVVTPLTTTVFNKEDVESAFRFVAQGNHIGKVLIKVREEESAKVAQPSRVLVSAIPRTACHPHKSYIITGGLGGFGLELAHWLVQRGAKNLVLTSRSGVRTGYQSRRLRLWKEAGVRVKVATQNVSRREDSQALVKDAAAMGPVGGVFHLAMVLRDGIMENQTPENFQTVGESKVRGTIHLDEVTRNMCVDCLDWFVVFSSIVSSRGNAGQAPYGFSNSLMDRICEQRRQEGLPGLAIQWGAIGDVGVIMDSMGGNETVVAGTLPQRINSCLATMDQFLNQPHPVVASMVLAEKKAKSTDQSSKTCLVDAVAHILGIQDVNAMNPDTSLADLGLDSLMGLEVKLAIERDTDMSMSMREIRLLTIDKLRDLPGGGGRVPATENT